MCIFTKLFLFVLFSVFLSCLAANTFPWMTQISSYSVSVPLRTIKYSHHLMQLQAYDFCLILAFSILWLSLPCEEAPVSFLSPLHGHLFVHTVKPEQCPSFEPLWTSSLCLIFSLILRMCYCFLIYQAK